jgi:ATP-binding cassette subfamily F protein 3
MYNRKGLKEKVSMVIASLQNVTKEYHGEKLFEPVTFQVGDKDRVALIGANGTGKSTIIKMITGEVLPDSGQIVIGNQYKIGYLSQSVISDLNNTLYIEALDVFKDLIKLEKDVKNICVALSKDHENEDLIKTYASMEERFLANGGYEYRYKVDEMLTKFGFEKKDFDRPISSFSGGERMKMSFAKLLLINPDLLVLDEPTNHLDISTIEWLESYLQSYQGSLIFVSHDRYFISSLATKIFEIDQKALEVYAGNYDYYAKEKKLRYEQKLKLYKRQQEEAKKLEWFIAFYMPKPRFASRAHDREKKLAKLENKMIDKPKITKNKVNINLQGSIREGKELIEATDLVIGYDNVPLISDINFTLYGSDKMAIMGQNGSGKTTFIKCILNHLAPISGELKFLTLLNIGYLKQDGINLRSPYSIFNYFREKFPSMANQEIYDHLANYAFNFEDLEKIIDNLSGGERMRVVFAELVLHNYDLLVLDEPTNHLDMMTKQNLIDALNDYKGSLFVVSHDRYFVDSICNRLVYFQNKKAYTYDGRYSDFKVEVLDEIEKETAALKLQEKRENAPVKKDYKPTHTSSKKRPKISKDKIEERMSKLDEKMVKLRPKLELPEYYNDIEKLHKLQEDIESAESQYEELFEMLEEYED